MNLWESPGFSGWKGIIISTLSRNLYSSSVFSIFKIKFEFIYLCLMVIHGFIAAGRANSTVHLYVKVWSSTLMGLKLRYALICTRLRIILSLFSSSPNNYEVLTTNHISKLLRTHFELPGNFLWFSLHNNITPPCIYMWFWVVIQFINIQLLLAKFALCKGLTLTTLPEELDFWSDRHWPVSHQLPY